MSNTTSAPAGPPITRPVRDEHRVIYHEPICPDCGSFDITKADIPTGDGITELALACESCGTCWPVACVVEWDGGR